MDEKSISDTVTILRHRIEASRFRCKRLLRSSLRCVMGEDRGVRFEGGECLMVGGS